MDGTHLAAPVRAIGVHVLLPFNELQRRCAHTQAGADGSVLAQHAPLHPSGSHRVSTFAPPFPPLPHIVPALDTYPAPNPASNPTPMRHLCDTYAAPASRSAIERSVPVEMIVLPSGEKATELICGGWRVEGEGWRVEGGEWRVEGGGFVSASPLPALPTPP